LDTPEAAARAEWTAYPEAQVRVVSVEYLEHDRAVVVTDTVPSHPMWNHCRRTNRGWNFVSDHN
jgi:hypothetical protein